jgi:Skp family chaperone for outer membrane proteins
MYRVPCDQNDKNKLISAFTNYKNFLDSKGNITPETADSKHFAIQAQKVQMYLQELNKIKPELDCIGGHELHGKSTTAHPDTMFSVLPKVFYLLYQHAQTGKQLDTTSIFDDYKTLSNKPEELLQEMEEDPELDSSEFEPVAVSVLRLMNFLEEKFPKLYRSHVESGDSKPAEEGKEGQEGKELVDLGDALDAVLDSIFDEDIEKKDAARDKFSEAHLAYQNSDLDKAVNNIKEALSQVVEYINGLHEKIKDLEAKLQEAKPDTEAEEGVVECAENLKGSVAELKKAQEETAVVRRS